MTDNEGKMPPPLSEGQLKQLVVEAINNAADLDTPETFHALFGHLDRGLTTDDILHGLEEEWQFDRPPVFNRFHWQWKYYIDTECIDGAPILIIIAVDTQNRSFEVITRWRRR